jgi:hypothetical protein
MTAGMTTRSMEGNRISLPRAGLGALLAGTLLAGSLLGAAVYAGVSAATSNPVADAAAVSTPLPGELNVVRDARISAGNGQLVEDEPGIPAGQGTARTIPFRGDGFGGDGFLVGNDRLAPVTITHAAGHGPLE